MLRQVNIGGLSVSIFGLLKGSFIRWIPRGHRLPPGINLSFNPLVNAVIDGVKVISGSVCKVRTQDTDNFDEEVKPLASAR